MTDLRRLYYISDPSSIATNLLPDPVRESDLRSWIDTVADAGVSTFCQEVFSQGWTAYFRSQHPDYEYDQRRQHRRFLPLLDGGVSPLDILIDEAHARGMGFSPVSASTTTTPSRRASRAWTSPASSTPTRNSSSPSSPRASSTDSPSRWTSPTRKSATLPCVSLPRSCTVSTSTASSCASATTATSHSIRGRLERI